MTYRGRLIQKFQAALVRADAGETSAVPGGGFSNVFKEPELVDDGTHYGSSSRREMDEVLLPVQIASRNWGGSTASLGGKQAEADMTLIFFQEDLENAGLLDDDGRVMIQQGDRIDRIETADGVLEEKFTDPPGLYVVSARKAGHGLQAFGKPKNNLVYVFCDKGRTS